MQVPHIQLHVLFWPSHLLCYSNKWKLPPDILSSFWPLIEAACSCCLSITSIWAPRLWLVWKFSSTVIIRSSSYTQTTTLVPAKLELNNTCTQASGSPTVNLHLYSSSKCHLTSSTTHSRPPQWLSLFTILVSPRHNTYSQIDLFLTNKWLLQLIKSASIHTTTWSDHAPISITLTDESSHPRTYVWVSKCLSTTKPFLCKRPYNQTRRILLH